MGKSGLAVKKAGNFDLGEMRAKAFLREVRLKGHVYVELRRDGKRTIFFCVLCRAPLFGETVVNDHLNGKFHARRYAGAKVTLFGPNPWPFSDGVFFFNTSCEREQNSQIVTSQRLIRGAGTTESNSPDRIRNSNGSGGQDTDGNENESYLMIPGVLINEQVTDLKAKFIGYGLIGSREQEIDDVRSKISKIWCAWLGKLDSENDSSGFLELPKCDFAMVSFPYTYYLGRKGALDDLNIPRSDSAFFEIDDSRRKKRKMSFSDTEDLASLHGSSGKDCPNLSSAADASHELQTSRDRAGKTDRRELRRQKRLAAERTCGICRHPLLAEKDVATLLNCKTGKFACSSRNPTGAFHLSHVSCLLHWILFREFQTRTERITNVKPTTRGRKAKLTQKDHIVICPECQGSGVYVEGDELERPNVPSISDMFLYQLKTIESHKAWMKNPEVLDKCSTGLHLDSDSAEKLQEKVVHIKLLQFYRADV